MDTGQPEQRRAKRFRHKEAVHLQFKDPTQFGGCLSCDLSQTGIRITVNHFVAIGTEVKLQVQVGPENMVDCLAKVVWVRELPYSDFYEAGLNFVDPPPSIQHLSM